MNVSRTFPESNSSTTGDMELDSPTITVLRKIFETDFIDVIQTSPRPDVLHPYLSVIHGRYTQGIDQGSAEFTQGIDQGSAESTECADTIYGVLSPEVDATRVYLSVLEGMCIVLVFYVQYTCVCCVANMSCLSLMRRVC